MDLRQAAVVAAVAIEVVDQAAADVEMAEADKRVTSAQADASVEHPAEFAGGKPGE